MNSNACGDGEPIERESESATTSTVYEADQSDSEEVINSREDDPVDYSCIYKDQDELDLERQAIEKAVRNKQISPSRAKLQLWLYRAMRIVITDGRILIGIFLCTDSKANIILGVCTEYTQNEGDERMIGLVMVPGEKTTCSRSGSSLIGSVCRR